MIEVWRNIEGYSKTQVSSEGRFRNKQTHEILTPYIDRGGSSRGARMRINVYKDDVNKSIVTSCHVLVMLGFMKMRAPSKMMICHNNSDFRINKPSNLRYDTTMSNRLDEYRNGKSYYSNGTTIYEVYAIRELFKIGYDRKKLSRIFNCSYSNINHIISRKRFKWLNDKGEIEPSKTGISYNDIILQRAKKLAESYSMKSVELDSGLFEFITME